MHRAGQLCVQKWSRDAVRLAINLPIRSIDAGNVISFQTYDIAGYIHYICTLTGWIETPYSVFVQYEHRLHRLTHPHLH